LKVSVAKLMNGSEKTGSHSGAATSRTERKRDVSKIVFSGKRVAHCLYTLPSISE